MAIGKWKEEGYALKSGNTLKGKVSHFTPWNYDETFRPNLPQIVPQAIISGNVITGCEENQFSEGISIQIGQTNVITDKKGNFRLNIPVIQKLVIVKNNLSNESKSINNLEIGKEYKINFVNNNFSFIVGRIIDCNNKLFEALAYAKWGNSGFTYNYAKNGLFKLLVPVKTDIQLQVGSQFINIKSLDSCEVKDLGLIKECDSTKLLLGMVTIPSGTFMMGHSPEFTPIRKITINKSFLMSKYEVTQKLWNYVYNSNPCYFKGNDLLPVENITWIDAVKFCNDLSIKEGLSPCYSLNYSILINNGQIKFDPSKNGYRLPTEAEWEYAAKSGTNTDFYQGNIDQFNINLIAWDNISSNDSTHQIGLKSANGWGLYDMHGNVSEYINDIYRNPGDNGTDSVIYYTTYNKINSDYESFLTLDPLLTNYYANLYYMFLPHTKTRGGSFKDSKSTMQSYFRKYFGGIDYKNNNTGFRLVRNLKN